MSKVIGAVEVDIDGCKGCELCVVACPLNVLLMSHEVNLKGYHYAYMENPENCTGCTNCGVICPDGAITVYRLKTQTSV